MASTKLRTPRQRAISYVATQRAVQIARDRIVRLNAERVAKEEAKYFAKWLAR